VLFHYRTSPLSPQHPSSWEDSGGWLWMRRAGCLASQEWTPMMPLHVCKQPLSIRVTYII
jgi:hypothetical protein